MLQAGGRDGVLLRVDVEVLLPFLLVAGIEGNPCVRPLSLFMAIIIASDLSKRLH